jgi:hypothetical protein
MADLREVEAVLNTGVEEEELQSALQAILFHQCLYEDWPYPPGYRLLARHFAQVRPILAAFGYRLVHHAAAQMLALEPDVTVYGVHMARLRKDETIVLLLLRLLYEEGISMLDERGRVEVTTDDLHDRLRTMGEEPPPLPRLREILRDFQRKGLVKVGDRDPIELMILVTIMPGIVLLVPDVYVEAIIQWAESRIEEREKGLLDHVADVKAHLGAAPAAIASTEAADA